MADREAEQLTPRIAHEDAGGIGIEPQEAEHGAGKGQAQSRAGILLARARQERHRAQTQQGGAARQAIESIRKIDGVGHADQKEHRERERNPSGQHHPVVQRDRMHLDVAQNHDDTDGDQLTDQLDAIVEIEPVVQRPEQHQHGARQEEPAILRPEAHRESGAKEDADRHGEAADARYRRGMHFPVARTVDDQPALPQSGEKRQRCHRGHHGQDEGHHVLHASVRNEPGERARDPRRKIDHQPIGRRGLGSRGERSDDPDQGAVRAMFGQRIPE